MKRDMRPKEYKYWNQLMNHLNNKPEKIFNNEFIWPRQFEIHLPGDHIRPCQLHCPHCAGKKFDKTLGTWEIDCLELLDKMKGSIPYHIFGGAYTEPLINPYFMTYIAMTKKYNNHFGIHTNGVVLKALDDQQGFLTELNRLSTDDVDYLSISLDAGRAENWAKTKGTTHKEWFNDIIEGVTRAVEIRNKAGKGHAIRLCYLISKYSGNLVDFSTIVETAKRIGVDSLRFSIPFDNYNKTFDEIRDYKKNIELPGDIKYRQLLEDLVSKSKEERPYIFFTGTEFTDIDEFTFERCCYGYYQITYAADGYVYKCSTSATPTAKQCRLGKATGDLDKFKEMIMLNYNKTWNCQEKCFSRGIRCNRMGLEISKAYEEWENLNG